MSSKTINLALLKSLAYAMGETLFLSCSSRSRVKKKSHLVFTGKGQRMYFADKRHFPVVKVTQRSSRMHVTQAKHPPSRKGHTQRSWQNHELCSFSIFSKIEFMTPKNLAQDCLMKGVSADPTLFPRNMMKASVRSWQQNKRRVLQSRTISARTSVTLCTHARTY